MTNRLAVVLALVLTWPVQSAAQPPVTVAAIQAAITRLGSLSPPSPGSADKALMTPDQLLRAAAAAERTARFNAAVTWLRNNAAKSDPALVSREYLQALERSAQLLERANGQPAVVEDVVRELEVKVDHCKRLGVGMGGSVALKVNTRRGGAVVGDWQVLYLLKFDEWLKSPPRTFPRVSSPTDARVEPGRYWVWARDPATGRSSERMLVEVAGRTEFRVDLPVP